MKVCTVAGCPTLVTTGRCTKHRAAHERDRGTRQQRGYDAAHQAERTRWLPLIAAGTVRCARCGHLIAPNQAWHLDHTDDRASYLGPSCVPCNTAAGGRAAHA